VPSCKPPLCCPDCAIFFSSILCFRGFYRFIDEKGRIHFTNLPTDKRYKVYVHSYGDIFALPNMTARYMIR